MKPSLSCPCPFGLSGLAVFAEGDSSEVSSDDTGL